MSDLAYLLVRLAILNVLSWPCMGRTNDSSDIPCRTMSVACTAPLAAGS